MNFQLFANTSNSKLMLYYRNQAKEVAVYGQADGQTDKVNPEHPITT